MNELIYLSANSINSFQGDTVALQLICKQDISKQDIIWTVKPCEAVKIYNCQATATDFLNDRVLLILQKAGEATVQAELNGIIYSCAINISEPIKVSSEDPMQYFIGDFHAHTGFSDGVGTPEDALTQAENEHELDFLSITDHASSHTPYKVFENVRAAQAHTNEKFVAFAAQESNIALSCVDEYGLDVNQAGELLTFNATGWADSLSWDEYFDTIGDNPATILGLAHPGEAGYSSRALWNGFNLPEVSDERVKKLLHMIEVVNCPTLETYNLLHERFYSLALDYGYHIAPTSGSDTHSWNWGSGSTWSRSVVLAPTLSKEALLDAMRNCRVYCTENGNVKLKFVVNGTHMGGTAALTTDYLIDIAISTFHQGAAGEEAALVEIISDYGKVIASKPLSRAIQNMTFFVQSDTARYFYLRITSKTGDHTWSAPIWTGRKADSSPLPPFEGKKIPTQCFAVKYATVGEHPEKVFNGNPYSSWESGDGSGEIIIDIGRKYMLNGIGYYHHYLDYGKPELVAQMLGEYKIEVSENGNSYLPVADGIMRSFGGEQIIRFSPVKGRFIKISALKTVGAGMRIAKYKDAKLVIGNITVFETGERNF